MVPHSPNVAYSDDESQVLWEDGERTFRRGWRVDDVGKRRAVLLVAPAADHPSRSNLDRLTHEFELKDELDRSWAVCPLDLVRDTSRTMLVLEDGGSEPVDRLLGAPMETGRFLHLAITSSLALSRLHQRGLVHKDIKPANLLVNAATGEVRLTGFGIASRLARERHSPDPPETIAGTLAYMAPEQTGRMNRSIDSRSDLYALGVTFYQMLTGALPFTAADPMEWVHCHLAKRPVPPAERLKEIPGAISAIVVKLLAKTAEDRYQTAAGLGSDLRNCQTQWEAQRRIDDFPLGAQDAPDRLLIPEKLYGRQREVETLLAAFDRILSGGLPELVLVSGYSGIGKSSVVNELQPVLVPPRGLFASGKFDQYKRDIPYSTLAQAFQGLIRPLLGKSEAELAPWRDTLREALGPNAGLIADLVPDVKLIIGEPPPVHELPPQDAQRRFQLVFRQFIDVFARPEHPLALFLDDLQWLDPATLDLLEDLLIRSDLRSLLLIGAYRDNEVTAAHPLMRKLEAIRAAGRVQDIKLTPLAANDLHDLIADALRCEAEQASQLAAPVHAKTGGNPFFVIQFLRTLADEGVVAFDHEHARWSWDLGGICAKGYTDNVVELLAGRLTRLRLETLDALRQLACLGSVADVATLSNVLGTSEEGVHAALWEAVNQHLVERRERAYRFVHDRVHEAAYQLIPEASREEAHLRVGRLLLAQTRPEERDEKIFEIVNQFNRSAPQITSSQERELLAELNLAAGKRAKGSAAYGSALTYLNTGAALLPENTWERRQELTFELELHLADCEVCTGALRAAEERLAALATRAVGTIQRCFVARRRVALYAMLGQGERAVTVALECLRHVGIDWSAHPSAAEARREYERISSLLGDRSIEDLVDLPLMHDPEARATVNLLTSLTVPAMQTDLNLAALGICRAANLSLELGNSDEAPESYQSLGMIASARFGHHEKGYRFGKMACDLLERRRWNHFGAGTCFVFATIVPWTRPIMDGIDPARRAFQLAKEHANPTDAALASRALTSILLASGHPLDQAEIEAEGALEFVLPFGFFLDRISAPLALVRMLRGRTAKFGSLDDGRFIERAFEERATSQPAQAFLECYYWLRKLQGRFFAGDYVSAVDAADRVATWYATSPSLSLFMLEKEEYHFYAALARAALCQPGGLETYARQREALKIHEQHLRSWAENCPQNFEDRATLVSAEIARIEGRELEAERLFEAAIKSARASEFVHNEALANELAARFHLARGFETIANAYLREARSCYLRWGADGKVRQLDQLHPRLRQNERAPGPTGTIEVSVERLDVATVIQIAQALSGEVVLEKLVDRLMRAAIKHAGADRGLLICPRSDELLIYAEATAHGEDIAIHIGERDASGAGALPESLVRYILRTGETVVLDDASSQNSFSADPYIIQGSARSILCLPMVNQGRFAGILYFENNLAPHVFTSDRLTALKVLAMQGAISLENVGLYRALANREAKIRRLFDANVLGICIWNLEGAIIEANEAFLQMLQYGREDVVSGRLRWTDLTPGELDERAIVELRSIGTFQPFEKEFLRKDGRRVPVLIGGALFEESRNQGVAFVLDLTERKRAEGALKHSETRYQNLFQAMAVSFFELDYTGSRPILRALRDAGVHDFRGHFKENPHLIREIMRTTYVVDVNDQTVALFGKGNKEELLTSVEAFWPEESLDDYVESVLATIAGNDKFSTETRVRRLDGTIFDALFTLRYVSDDKTRGLAGVIDITERKRAEEALRKSEYELRQIIDAVPGLIWSAGPDGVATYVSQRLLEYTGSQLEDNLKRHGWEVFLHPEELAAFTKDYYQAIQTGTPYRGVLRLRCADGAFRWHDVLIEPLRDHQGRVIQWYGLSVNVDDAKKAEGALRESEAKFRAAIDGIAGLVAIMAPSGELESVNRPIIEYFGRSVEELKDWGTGDAVHPDDLPRVRESFGTSLAAGIPFHQELRLRRFDGEYRWFENRGAPIRDEFGRISRWYCLLIDIEDRTQALARLQQMQSDFAHINRVNTMGELAASLSHEIMHPIATARNNARAGVRFLEMNLPNLDEVKEALSCVVRDVDRAKDIVSRVRDHIKKAPARREAFDLNEAVHEALVMVRSSISRNKIAVTAHLMDEKIPVRGDRVQLQQVVVNLILNAVEAISSEERGTRELSIRIEQHQAGNGGVLVQVRDSGPGIDPEKVELVFEPFYTTKTSGVGMGLSICRSIINDHGGRLWAEANEPRGAVFQFTLPGAGAQDVSGSKVFAAP
jgi:PAS domain S-box-containing protein